MIRAEYDPERDLLRHTCAWTAEQRLQWLEEALNFALETGALEKTRRLQERQADTAKRQAPPPPKP